MFGLINAPQQKLFHRRKDFLSHRMHVCSTYAAWIFFLPHQFGLQRIEQKSPRFSHTKWSKEECACSKGGGISLEVKKHALSQQCLKKMKCECLKKRWSYHNVFWLQMASCNNTFLLLLQMYFYSRLKEVDPEMEKKGGRRGGGSFKNAGVIQINVQGWVARMWRLATLAAGMWRSWALGRVEEGGHTIQMLEKK